MQLEWNLTRLFNNEEEAYEKVNEIRQSLELARQFENEEYDAQTLLEVLNFMFDLKQKANNILIYGSLRYYKDIKSNEAKTLKEVSEKIVDDVKASFSFLDKKILSIGRKTIDEYLSSNEELRIYSLYIDNIFRLNSHIQDEETNKLIGKLKSEISQLLVLFNSICHDMSFGTINIDDKNVELTIFNIGKYSVSSNREIRKQVYESLAKEYMKHKDELADIINNIYTKRNKISLLEGYDSLEQQALFSENIDPNVLKIMIDSVSENTNLLNDYIDFKMKYLGIDDAHRYDIGAPIISAKDHKYLLDEAIRIIKEALKPLGNQYLEVVDILLSQGYIEENKNQFITFSRYDF